MSIELKNVTYTYSPGTAYEIHALKDINLSIPDGQFIGIIGHTGSGKSTLIQHFNALIRPTSGTITYNGEDIWGEKYDRRALRSEVGLVFQYPEHQLFENDVLSDVCFGPMNQGLSREEAEVEAKHCSMWDLKRKITANLLLNSRADRRKGLPLPVYWQ